MPDDLGELLDKQKLVDLKVARNAAIQARHGASVHKDENTNSKKYVKIKSSIRSSRRQNSVESTPTFKEQKASSYSVVPLSKQRVILETENKKRQERNSLRQRATYYSGVEFRPGITIAMYLVALTVCVVITRQQKLQIDIGEDLLQYWWWPPFISLAVTALVVLPAQLVVDFITSMERRSENYEEFKSLRSEVRKIAGRESLAIGAFSIFGFIPISIALGVITAFLPYAPW